MVELLSSTWTAINALDPKRRIFVMVIGPTEQHGPHLPLGTDIYAAEEMANRIIAMLEDELGRIVIKAPPLNYTPAVLSRLFPGSVSIRKAHYRAFLEDILQSFAINHLNEGILISSHLDPPFIKATQDACHIVNRDHGSRLISGYERFPLEDIQAGVIHTVLGYEDLTDIHAGLIETSNMAYIRPELVNMNTIQNLPNAPLTFTKMAELRSLRDFANGLGYVGYPAHAKIDYGRQWFEHYGERFKAVVRRYCQGEDVWDDLRIDALLS